MVTGAFGSKTDWQTHSSSCASHAGWIRHCHCLSRWRDQYRCGRPAHRRRTLYHLDWRTARRTIAWGHCHYPGLVGGALAGGVWGGVSGYLKAKMDVNEILSTVMLNALPIQIAFLLLRGPMIDRPNWPQERIFHIRHGCPKRQICPCFTDLAQMLGITGGADEVGIGGYLGEIYNVLVQPSRLHSGFIFAVIMPFSSTFSCGERLSVTVFAPWD